LEYMPKAKDDDAFVPVLPQDYDYLTEMARVQGLLE
jgi:hypothetical protein